MRTLELDASAALALERARQRLASSGSAGGFAAGRADGESNEATVAARLRSPKGRASPRIDAAIARCRDRMVALGAAQRALDL